MRNYEILLPIAVVVLSIIVCLIIASRQPLMHRRPDIIGIVCAAAILTIIATAATEFGSSSVTTSQKPIEPTRQSSVLHL
jgi:hypothetical protein